MRSFFPEDSQNRILLLTAGFGDGHNTAARNIRDALEREALERGLEGVEIQVVDLLDSAHPQLSAFLRRLYRFGIAYAPGLWHKLYRFSDQIDLKSDPFGVFAKSTLMLKRNLEKHPPRAVISTYMVYPQQLERISGRHGDLPFPSYTVVTDSGTINAVWRKGRTDRFFVADARSEGALIDQGVDPVKVEACGFPINLKFSDLADHKAGPPEPPRVLYFPMTSKKHVGQTLKALTQLNSGMQLTVVMGRSEDRLSRAVRRAVGRREGVDLIGWTNRIPELLANHHAVIGKAGGASVQEALAASKPLILNYVVPGQEEGNAQLAEALGFGMRAHGPEEVAAAISGLFENKAARWKEMSEKAKAASRPHAARTIARSVLDDVFPD